MYQRKELHFLLLNYRSLPAGGNTCFLPSMCSRQFRHSLIPQLCIFFDPELIKKCKSKLYLINVILVLKLWEVKIPVSLVYLIFNVQRRQEPDYLQAMFSNQLLYERSFIVLLFLAFLNQEIKSNDFIVIPQVFPRHVETFG